MTRTLQPRQPANSSVYARACIEALSRSGLGDRLSLGGAFGLAHYYEFRSTQDIDAWWQKETTHGERQRVVAVVEEALRPFGAVHTRAWGEVVSIELTQEKRKVFSFQIAARSALLSEPIRSPWEGVQLDTLDDLVASKMAALVERGAPRDFRDIHALCTAGILTIARCWTLWQTRQQLAGEATDRSRAALAIRTHLARIAQARPLDGIVDARERHAAEQVRAWFAQEFLRDMD